MSDLFKELKRRNVVRFGIAFAIGVIVLFPFSESTTLAAGVTYTIFDEKIYDGPIKTQISQDIIVSGVPTRAELEAEILGRYHAATARRGFQYHNNRATNIYIYVYGTEEQARSGMGLWIGMIAKSFSDKGTPQVIINEDRLAALSLPPEERFGLSERVRKQVFLDIVRAEDRAARDAMARVPDSPNIEQIKKQINLQRELEDKYRAMVAQEFGLTTDQLREIGIEGATKGWPFP